MAPAVVATMVFGSVFVVSGLSLCGRILARARGWLR
jgi:hypothetical protein